MTIKEVEERTGLSRSNIRFYERENLIFPKRNEKNKYREYSEQEVEDIKKIAYLRTLDISVEDIRKSMEKEESLYKIIEKQSKILEQRIYEMENAKILCEKMLLCQDLNFEELDITQFVLDVPEYWHKNQKRLRTDTISLIERVGSKKTWMGLTIASLAVAMISFFVIPEEIPVQWSQGQAVSFQNKLFSFAYPAVCIGIRVLLSRVIRVWLYKKGYHSTVITDYLTNFVCFLIISGQIFSVLFSFGIVKYVERILIVEIVIFMGLLAAGWNQALIKEKQE